MRDQTVPCLPILILFSVSEKSMLSSFGFWNLNSKRRRNMIKFSNSGIQKIPNPTRYSISQGKSILIISRTNFDFWNSNRCSRKLKSFRFQRRAKLLRFWNFTGFFKKSQWTLQNSNLCSKTWISYEISLKFWLDMREKMYAVWNFARILTW